MENLVRRRYRWFLLSGIMIVPGLLVMLFYPLLTTGQFRLGLNVGIDFTSGALWEVRFVEAEAAELNTGAIAEVFAESGFESALVQLSSDPFREQDQPSAIVRTRELASDNLAGDRDRVLEALSGAFGATELDRLETVGPTISQRATFGALLAVLGASVFILVYLTWAFRNAPHPIRYGICALISMAHDVLFMIGAAAILGILIGLEVNALFLTAVLTTLSFSVHDTIVVFDRVRENLALRRDETFDEIVNHSLVQTLPRSINTQLTTMFVLIGLLIFGGETIFDFVLVLLLGLISGTYSSIFNAAQVLVVWEHKEWQTWFKGSSEKPSTASS